MLLTFQTFFDNKHEYINIEENVLKVQLLKQNLNYFEPLLSKISVFGFCLTPIT